MNRGIIPEDGRIAELLAQRATEGLSPAEAMELRVALQDGRSGIDEEGLDLAAAAFDRAFAPPVELPLPAGLEDKLRAMARDFARVPVAKVRPPNPKASPFGMAAGWVAAAVAVIALFIVREPSAEPMPAADELARRLERSAPDLIRVPWKGDGPYSTVQGEVLFSRARQEGYLRLRNLPRNDPSREQYQLWIVDKTRDVHPVDGGIFDVSTDGEAVIRIRSALAIENPSVFAITVEKPGGVVVSKGPLHVVAQL